MTEKEFRTNPSLRVELRAAMETTAFRHAKSILMEAFQGTDTAGEAVHSIRLLSQRAGFERAFQRLAEMTELPPEPQAEPVMDYGQAEATAKLIAMGELPPPFTPNE